MMMSDRTITLADQNTFDSCFRDNYQTLCFFASTLIGDEVASEDAVQEVFVKLLNSPRIFESEIHLRNYLFTAVRNQCIDRQRERQKWQLDDLAKGERPDDDTVEAMMVKSEMLRLVDCAVRQLPEGQQKVFALAYYEGKSNEEIARELNLSLNTVKVQKQRAKIRLRDQLKDLFPIALLLLQTAAGHP